MLERLIRGTSDVPDVAVEDIRVGLVRSGTSEVRTKWSGVLLVRDER